MEKDDIKSRMSLDVLNWNISSQAEPEPKRNKILKFKRDLIVIQAFKEARTQGFEHSSGHGPKIKFRRRVAKIGHITRFDWSNSSLE